MLDSIWNHLKAIRTPLHSLLGDFYIERWILEANLGYDNECVTIKCWNDKTNIHPYVTYNIWTRFQYEDGKVIVNITSDDGEAPCNDIVTDQSFESASEAIEFAILELVKTKRSYDKWVIEEMAKKNK